MRCATSSASPLPACRRRIAKLVTTETRHDVGVAHTVPQDASDGADHLVPGLVSVRVVDVTELVYVEQKESALVAVAGGVLEV